MAIENSYLQRLKNIKDLITIEGENLSKSRDVKDALIHYDRNSLYNYSINYFNSLKRISKNNNIRMHFHLPNHKSFLRVHKPTIFGDNLENIRPIITETMFENDSLSGFEYGKHDKNEITYRITFPILDEKENLLGVLEIGVDFNIIIDDIEKEFKEDGKNIYLVQRMKKGVINFNNFNNFYVNIDKCLFKKSEETEPILKEYGRTNKKQVTVDNRTYNLVFDKIKIKDFFSNQIGSFVYIVDITDDLKQNKIYFYTSLSKPIVAIILIGIFIYFIFQYLFNQIHKMENRTKNILNAQKAMIVLTDGKLLLDCNKSLLEYYKCKNIFEFRDKYECICNTFEERTGFLQKYNNDIFWIDYILENRDEFFKVLIKDKKGNENIFTVGLSKFDENSKLNIPYYVVTLTNITELEKINLQLIEQSKQGSLGEMIGNIAHQWRQPLSTISTISSSIKLYIEMNMLKNDDLYKSMDAILDRTKYLSETIDIFRNFLKEKKEEKEVVLQDRVDMAISIIDTVLVDNHINLIKNINYDDKIMHTMVVGELTQVIINIINNAKDILIENPVEKPQIIISLFKEKNMAILTIEDNGGGIPEKVLPKIFEPYFTTKHQTQGTGLGLHMSYKIVKESFCGNIYAKNVNNGAKFFIEIPLKD